MDQNKPNVSPLHELEQLRHQYVELKAAYEKNITLQKQTEEALQQSEHKFFVLFEKSPFPASLSRLPEGTIVNVNEAFEREFGFTKQEALGKTTFELGINPDAEGRKRILEALSAGGFVRNQEMVLRSKPGENIYYETNIEKVLINGEEYLINTAQNITKYKRAENKLKENFDLLRIAGEKAKLGGWNVILNENRSYWSDEVAAIHEMPAGYSPLVEDGINFYAPEWRDKITEVFTRCAKEGIHYDEEMEIITATGKRVWVRTMGEAVRDEKGNIFKVQGAFQDITTRKQAENELKNSEARYKAIFESTGTATLIVDQDTIILLANNECLNITGYAPAELTGKKWTNYVAEESLKEMLRNHQLRRENQELAPRKYEVKLLNSKGEKRDVILQINMIPGTKQSVVSMLDITERKQAEEKLKTSDRIFKHSLDMLCIAGFNGYFKVLNPAWTRILGWSNEELRSKPWIDFVHPDDRDNTKDIKAVIVDGIEVYQFENRYMCKDGAIKWLSWNSFPYHEENIMFGVARDVTVSKQREMIINNFFEQPLNINLIADFDGKINRANSAWDIYLGYRKDEILGRNFFDFIHPDDISITVEVMKKIEKGITTFHFENRYRHKNGEYRKLAWSSITSLDEHLVYAVAIDITEKQQAEKALLAKMDELESFRKLMVGREVTMVELKKEVNNLLKKLGEIPKYKIVE